MKSFFNYLVLALMFSPVLLMSQEDLSFDHDCEININHPSLSISKEDLACLESLHDLDPNYKSDWIREYISVDLISYQNGIRVKSTGNNATLTDEQIKNLRDADIDREIEVSVRYMPENTLSHNEPQEINFKFTFDPEHQANYPGGSLALDKYLKSSVLNELPQDVIKSNNFAAITFTVNTEGQIITPHIFWSSENEDIDALLLNAICKMPNWTPAVYSSGIKVAQDFVLTVGDMKSCVVNLVNIKKGTKKAIGI